MEEPFYNARKKVLKNLLESNLNYYKIMTRAFPNEKIWKKCIKDTEKLLKEASQ